MVSHPPARKPSRSWWTPSAKYSCNLNLINTAANNKTAHQCLLLESNIQENYCTILMCMHTKSCKEARSSQEIFNQYRCELTPHLKDQLPMKSVRCGFSCVAAKRYPNKPTGLLCYHSLREVCSRGNHFPPRLPHLRDMP